jgi:hypothetical protein
MQLTNDRGAFATKCLMNDEAANLGESAESSTGPSAPRDTSSAPAQISIDIPHADADVGCPGVLVSLFECSDAGISALQEEVNSGIGSARR